MTTQLHRSLAILLVFLLAAVTAASPPAPPVTPPPAEQAQEAMPDGLMSAFLEASSQPFTPDVDGYRAHSGGLDFALDATGLQANLGSFALRLALRAWGREGQLVTLPDVQIAQADGRLEYHRGALTEWYRDTALGVEQGFTIHQPPGGKGPLVLQLDLATNLVGEADADGHGLSFTTPDGQTLRYDHLRAWDADAVPLEVCLGYTRGQVRLQVNDQSATYPVTVDPLIYAEQQVTASDGEAYDSFGYSVALWGNTALVGAPDGYMSTGPDSAYVFTWTESGWSEQQKLTASDGETWDGFGRSVALWGDTALVGAFADDVDTNSDQGSAYVFTRDGTTWSEQAHLTASDGAAADYFGGSVALWDDTALVGAAFHDAGQGEYQGSAYVFTRSATTWSEQARLTASDAASGDLFGYSVALWGDTALVGASWDGVGLSEHQGSAYVFTRSGTSWSEQQKLTASDGEEGDSFGSSVALEG
jgi:hypothetical protein